MVKRSISHFLAASVLTMSCIFPPSCSRIDGNSDVCGNESVTVSFGVSGGVSIEDTRTCIADDGLSTHWAKGDKVALWAFMEGGSPAFNGIPFSLHGAAGNTAVFTGELPGVMDDGNYTYVAVSPVPNSVSGNSAEFILPAVQDGKAGGGADIMVSQAVSYGPLKPYSFTSEDYSGMTIRMSRHFTHLLNFYLPEGSDGLKVESEGMAHGEPVKRIDLTLPVPGIGKTVIDIANPDEHNATATQREMRLVMNDNPLQPSTDGKRNYASASILPPDNVLADDAKIGVRLYSENYIGYVDSIPAGGRSFEAGHATPVPLNVTHCVRKKMRFKLNSNNLGEDVTSMMVEADGNFSPSVGNVYSTSQSSGIEVGSEYLLKCGSEAFQNLAGTVLKITCQSKHVKFSTVAALPADLDSYEDYAVNIDVPYLLFEDFSTVPSFSSYDEHSATEKTGDNFSYTFTSPAGWTGGRVGARDGDMIRIAGYRQSGMWADAHYPARVDSAPLLEIISPVNIAVTFDYGINSDGINKYGQTIYVGYVTSTKVYKSGDTDGTFGYSKTFADNDKDSDWTTPRTETVVINNIPAGTTNRISWRNDPKTSSDFASNTTAWLYLDNVKVQVAP